MKPWLTAALLVVVACGKSEPERRWDIARCSATSSDALEIQLCLEANRGWKDAEAGPAAARRARELDSLEALRADSVWATGATKRRSEIRECAGPQLVRCLLVQFGWPEQRAKAADDSVWRASAASHQREIVACARQRDSNVSSCLLLQYQWSSDRALAVADSIARAKMR